MLTILAAIAAIAGALGLLYAALARRARPVPGSLSVLSAGGGWPVLAFAAIVAVLLFLSALPTFEPFQPGLTLGWGFLLGAVLGLWVLFDGAEPAGEDSNPSPERAVRPLSAAALAVSAVLLLFHGYPNDALAGCALGAAFAAACPGSILRARWERWEATVHGLEVYALATAAAASGAWLGIAHYQRAQADALEGGYWALPSLLLGAGSLVLILAAFGPLTRMRALAAGLVSAAAIVLVAGLLQWKLLPGLSWPVLVYGPVAAAFLVGAFLREEPDPDAPDTALMGRPTLLALGAALLAVLVPAIAFRGLQGYGQALTVVAALPVVAVAYIAPIRRPGLRFAEAFGMAFVTLMLLLTWLRVFLERAEALRLLDFQLPYNLLAIVIGAACCFGVLAFHERAAHRAGYGRPEPDRPGFPPSLYGQVVLLGFFTVAAPLVVAALWGPRAVAALIAGLAAGEAVWMLLLAWARAERLEVLSGAPHVILLSAALIGAQLGPVVAGMELTRAHKVMVVVVVAILVIIGLIVDAIRSARETVAVREVRDEPAA